MSAEGHSNLALTVTSVGAQGYSDKEVTAVIDYTVTIQGDAPIFTMKKTANGVYDLTLPDGVDTGAIYTLNIWKDGNHWGSFSKPSSLFNGNKCTINTSTHEHPVEDGSEFLLKKVQPGYTISAMTITNVSAKVTATEEATSTDATLSNLTVDGTPVTDFAAGTLAYNVVLAAGTTVVPTVVGTVTATDKANTVVTPATGLPGTTTVVVTAEDGTTTQTYTINFTVALSPSTAPSSADITVTNNNSGNDTVAVTSLTEGDVVKVYNISTGGTLLGTSSAVASGETSATVTIAQLGTGAGDVYVTVTSTGKAESTPRTLIAYGAEAVAVPGNLAAGATFIDTNNHSNKIAGNVVITKAADESDVDSYVVYYLDASHAKVGAAIGTVAKTANPLQVVIAADTSLPVGATQLGVYSLNAGGESATATKIALTDDNSFVATKEITGLTALNDVAVATDLHLMDLAALKASGMLPTKVTVTDGTTPVDATITEWAGTFDGTTGEKTLTATWTMPEGYADATDPITVTVKVNVTTAQTVSPSFVGASWDSAGLLTLSLQNVQSGSTFDIAQLTYSDGVHSTYQLDGVYTKVSSKSEVEGTNLGKYFFDSATNELIVNLTETDYNTISSMFDFVMNAAAAASDTISAQAGWSTFNGIHATVFVN